MNQTTRRAFLKKLTAGAVASSLPFQITSALTTSSSRRKPNIMLIMIDDLGWMDLHCQGNKNLDTPNIDRLAKDGMRFTDAYAAAPVCSPTRASIMTGQSPARLGITNHIPDRIDFQPENAVLKSAETSNHLPLEHTTVAEHLKTAGYTTAFLGKWHLSGKYRSGDQGKGDSQYQPEYQGFDINIGGCCYGGPSTYFDPYKIHNIPPRKKGEYLPYRFADEAEIFIRKNRSKPFFLALWNYTVHWPMEAPPELVEKYESRLGPGIKDARYAAMIEAMDKSIGQVVKTVDDLGLGKNSLIIFTSDNGGYSGVADNRPLRDGKGTLYEGGIRIPLIARWTGTIAPNTTSATPVISTDFYPTLLAAAGLKPKPDTPLDGENLMPLLKQTAPLRRDSICFHYPNYAFHRSNRLGGAIRSGDYKLIEHYDDDSVELYNVKTDLSEKTDLSKQKPDLARKLKSKLDRWLKETGANMPERIKPSEL